MQAKSRRPKITASKPEFSETMGAYLVRCYVDGELVAAHWTEEPEAEARAMRYDAAAEL